MDRYILVESTLSRERERLALLVYFLILNPQFASLFYSSRTQMEPGRDRLTLGPIINSCWYNNLFRWLSIQYLPDPSKSILLLLLFLLWLLGGKIHLWCTSSHSPLRYYPKEDNKFIHRRGIIGCQCIRIHKIICGSSSILYQYIYFVVALDPESHY